MRTIFTTANFVKAFSCFLFGFVSSGCGDAGPPQPRRLTVEQTLKLSHHYPFDGTGEKHHLFRVANPSANAQLVSQCRELGSSDKRINSAPLVLGYTGGSAEALALIAIIGSTSDRYAKNSESFLSGRETRFLTTVFLGLGQMGQRGIPEAREFLKKAITGNAPELSGLRWYGPKGQTDAMILDLALPAYAVTQPEDLASKLASAKDRIKRTHPDYYYRMDVESLQDYVTVIERQRRQPVTDAEKQWLGLIN